MNHASIGAGGPRLLAAVEAVSEAIVVTDRKGYIEYVNPAFETATGLPRSMVLGEGIHVLDGHGQDHLFYEALRDELSRNDRWSGMLESQRSDGRPYREACTISPIRDDDGAIAGYIHVRRDVTEEARLRAAAEAVDAATNQ